MGIKTQGKLIIISGPSGVGKDTIVACLQKLGLKFNKIKTITCRPPRPGEKRKKRYFFVTSSEFKRLIKKKKLVEFSRVYGYYYGSLKEEVAKKLKKSKLVLIQVDPQGARKWQKLYPKSKVIFLIPPSLSFLKKRLRKRGEDPPDIIKRRLKDAKKELTNLKRWDEVIVNEEGKSLKTAKEVLKIIREFLEDDKKSS